MKAYKMLFIMIFKRKRLYLVANEKYIQIEESLNLNYVIVFLCIICYLSKRIDYELS